MPINASVSGRPRDPSYAGTIGGEILTRFHLVLDYAHHRLGLTPYPGADDRFGFDGSGLAGLSPPESRTMEITTVYDGSPAAAAGIRCRFTATAGP